VEFRTNSWGSAQGVIPVLSCPRSIATRIQYLQYGLYSYLTKMVCKNQFAPFVQRYLSIDVRSHQNLRSTPTHNLFLTYLRLCDRYIYIYIYVCVCVCVLLGCSTMVVIVVMWGNFPLNLSPVGFRPSYHCVKATLVTLGITLR
jgi:hypothetical protein